MAEEQSLSAVYVSWATLKNALESLAQGVPNQIDRSTFPGLSGGVQSQLLAGMKFLGLIDENNAPTPSLHAVAVPDESRRKEQFKRILEERYSELFALDLVKTTPQQLSARMGEAYAVTGDTKDKAVRFFLSAVQYVGVPISRLFTKMPGATTNGTKSRRRSTPRARPVWPESQTPPEGAKSGASKVVSLESGGTLTLTASVDLFQLSPTDREFVFDLIDRFDKYKKGEAAN